MWIFTPFILGGVILLAYVLGSMGLLCTRDRRDWAPGLLFGLPVIVASLLIFDLFVQVELFWAGIFTVPSLIIGSLVVWRGFRTGKKRRDCISAVFVCGGICFGGAFLIQHPEITRVIFSRILPAAPIL